MRFAIILPTKNIGLQGTMVGDVGTGLGLHSTLWNPWSLVNAIMQSYRPSLSTYSTLPLLLKFVVDSLIITVTGTLPHSQWHFIITSIQHV
jgi:hypothetical protein